MGRELNLQAIPEESELIQIARQDVEVAEMLSQVGSVFEGKNLFSRYKDEASRVIDEKAQEILKQKPYIGKRKYYDVGRQYDVINYLLCEKRRLNSALGFQYSPIHVAIYGNKQIHPEIESSLGFDITLVTADYVPTIVTFIKGVSFKEFKQFWHPATMEEVGVYKMDSTMDERDLVFCWNELQRMLSFYASVAEHEEAVLAWIT